MKKCLNKKQTNVNQFPFRVSNKMTENLIVIGDQFTSINDNGTSVSGKFLWRWVYISETPVPPKINVPYPVLTSEGVRYAYYSDRACVWFLRTTNMEIVISAWFDLYSFEIMEE